jgi:hypothetical protein
MADTPADAQGAEAAKGKSAPDLVKAAQGLVERSGGDALAAVVKLLDEAHDGREERRVLRVELDGLKAKLPEGAVILTGDDAKAWPAYTALGKPDELAATVATGKTASEQLAAIDAQKTLDEAATLTGLKAKPLAGLLKAHDRRVVVEDVTGEDGTVRRVALVKPLTGEGESKPLADFAATDLADYLPALKADGTSGTATQTQTTTAASTTTSGHAATGAITVFPEQGSSRGKAPVVSAEQLAQDKRGTAAYNAF